MKTIVLVLGVGVLLTCTGCNRPTDDTTAKKVAAIEAKVETLEKRNSDLALKGRIVSSQLFGSPLDNFFASDEFWQNTYDSGQADCAKRCISTLTSERKACEKIANDAKRQQCLRMRPPVPANARHSARRVTRRRYPSDVACAPRTISQACAKPSRARGRLSAGMRCASEHGSA